MLEPSIIRQTATLTEWHGTHGTATADNAKVYALTLANMERNGVGLWLPRQGVQVELNLYQNQHGKTEFVICAPIAHSQNVEKNRSAFNDFVYEHTSGRRFFTDKTTFKKQFFINTLLLFSAILLTILLEDSLLDVLLMMGILVLLILEAGLLMHMFSPHDTQHWQFTVNEQGIAFCLVLPKIGSFVHWRNWTDIKHISFGKSMIFKNAYCLIECHLPILGKYQIDLSGLSEKEREIAQEMIMQYFQAA